MRLGGARGLLSERAHDGKLGVPHMHMTNFHYCKMKRLSSMHLVAPVVLWVCMGCALTTCSLAMECTNISTAQELYQRATNAVPDDPIQLCITPDAPRCCPPSCELCATWWMRLRISSYGWRRSDSHTAGLRFQLTCKLKIQASLFR